MRPDSKGFHQDENRHGRFDEHPGIGRVQDLEVLLQDGFRHEGDKERGSGVCAAAEVLHFQIEGRTGTHTVQEFCTGGSGRKGDDKGRAEQAQRYLKFCIIKSFIHRELIF